MYIVVVGSGAMGCLYGGALWEKGHEVVLVDVWPEHIEAINQKGLTIETEVGSKTIRVPAKYSHQVEGEADLIIIFTKTVHTEKALANSQHFMGENTVVLTLQNGLGNVELIEKFVPKERIIVGVTNFPSDLVGPGYIRSRGVGVTKIMSADGNTNSRLEDIRKALDDVGFNCEVSIDVFVSIWEKVAFNAALNTLTAVTKISVGSLGAIPEGRKLAFQIAEEVITVANKKGISARKEAVLGTLENVFVEHGSHMPSMLQDVLAQRATEIEAINGVVVREARILGLSVPATEVLYDLIRIFEQSYSGKCLVADS